ncbi:MAG: LPS assembly lipoprotein LptE [Woeseiaceae bacterium]
MSRVVMLVALLVAGCGFQMQGALIIPPEMARTYISIGDENSQFYRALRKQLQEAGVDIVDSAAASTATLSITFDETDQRVLSVSARNVPTEYEVYYTIQYGIDDGVQNLLEPQTLTVTRDYTYDSRLVLGKEREEELLRKAIVDDLVHIVLKQIATL